MEFNLTSMVHDYKCAGPKATSAECLLTNTCPQLHGWMIKTALAVLVLYMLHLWVWELGIRKVVKFETKEKELEWLFRYQSVCYSLTALFVGVVCWLSW